jgi:3-dehydroquinate synthase
VSVPAPRGIRVEVPVQRTAYDVIVRPGVLDELHSFLPPASRYVVITDHHVAPLHGARVLDALRGHGLTADLLDFTAGEANKTRSTWTQLTDRLLGLGAGRDACVIALGGGVVGDLACLVAATYMRGLPVVQVPTTLLAMVDAAVGGKTGVDVEHGKNLVGVFHHPHAVIADPLVLNTLPPQQLRAGLAEAVKHGAILDAAHFDWIHDNAQRLLSLDPEAVSALVTRSVELKGSVVAEDPREHGRRVLLNFGHTVGHALELCSGYTLLHGFAVAAGLRAEARAGELAGITADGTADRVTSLLRACELPLSVPGLDADRVLDGMRMDKKTRAAAQRVVLLAVIGRCARTDDGKWTHALPRHVLRQAVQEVIRDRDNV